MKKKINISEHAKNQLSIGSQIRSISLSEVQLYNWYNRDDKHTIHRQLMTIESITTKTVVRSDGNKTFRGRLFYAIIPNSKKKTFTFYYSKANSTEARSVVRGLPFFIRDRFKIKPSFCCSSSLIANVLQGSWIFSIRKYTSQDEMEQHDKFGLLMEEIAPKE